MLYRANYRHNDPLRVEKVQDSQASSSGAGELNEQARGKIEKYIFHALFACLIFIRQPSLFDRI